MDVILARAGLSGAQQRVVCLGAVKDEAQQTEAKLTDALAALRRLQEVARVARDVHKAQGAIAFLSHGVEASMDLMTRSSRQFSPLLTEIQSTLNAFTSRGSREDTWSSTEEEEEEEEEAMPSERSLNQDTATPRYTAVTSIGSSGWSSQRQEFSRSSGPAPSSSFFRVRDQPPTRLSSGWVPQRTSPSSGAASLRFASTSVHVGQKRPASGPPAGHSFLRPDPPRDVKMRREQTIWPQHGEYLMLHRRPRPPVQQTEKKVSLIVDELKQRLSRLPSDEQDGVFSNSIKSALKVIGLPQVKGDEESVQEAVDNARAAVRCLLQRHSTFSGLGDEYYRLEDLRHVLSVVVRATLDTSGRLDALGLRDLLGLVKKLQHTFSESAARFKWCSTQLRRFITAKYKKTAQIAVADQNRLSTAVAETRKWKSLNDYSASKFADVMSFVSEVLEGSYEDWEPREDSQLAELIGIMITRLGAFRDSIAQQGRQVEVHGWLYKMSGDSFSPKLDLVSVPPPRTAGVYVANNQGFCSMEDVEDGFKRISQAKARKYFGYFTLTLYTFLATAVLTKNQKQLLPINQLNRFNESLQGLKELDVNGERSAVLQSYQGLEKILYLMRVLMQQRPEYLETSVGTVDTLLALFPPSKQPTFVYPSSIAPPQPSPKSTSVGGSIDDIDD